MGEERLRREDAGSLQRWRLVRARGNALDEETLQLLADAFQDARSDPRPVVLCGRGHTFCTGLDLSRAVLADRETMARWMEGFHRALTACFLHPAPVVAALGGHALAGGALLALACDRRLMAKDSSGRFGVHGIRLGVSYPQVAIEILRAQFPRAVVEELLYSGRVFTPEQACEAGLVDRVLPAEELENEAEKDAIALLAGGRGSFADLKEAIRRPARLRLQEYDPAGAAAWLDQWFLEETQGRLREALNALGRKK